jgi:putative DNA primase/helicase
MNMRDPRHREASVRRLLDDHAREELRAMAAEIVRSFLGEPNRKLCTTRQWRWGRKGSFVLNVAGDKKGLWYDHENEVGGDVIKFLQVQLGCSVADAIAHAFGILGPSWSPLRSIAPRPRPIQAEPDDGIRVDQALKIWAGVLPLRGSLAEQYLAGRGIHVPDEALDVLGFHPKCPFGSRRASALVALIQDIVTGEPVGVHRRELTLDGTSAGTPMALGPKSHGAIMLASPRDGELAIGEGVETCLAGMMLGFEPAWSVLDAGGIANFPILDHVQRLTVLVDNEESGTGQRAASTCHDRWAAGGKGVRRVMPDRLGDDANDLLHANSARSSEHA